MCEKIKIAYIDPCFIGGIDLSVGFHFFVAAKVLEAESQYKEEGSEDENLFVVPYFQRLDLKHVLSTNLMPSYMVDAFRLLQYVNQVTITENATIYRAYDIEVETDWANEDKEMALIRMVFRKDEPILKTGCCDAVIVE